VNETITFRRRNLLLVLVLLLLALAVAVLLLELRLGRAAAPAPPRITSAPLQLTLDPGTVFAFEGGDDFECALDSARYSGCSSPIDYGSVSRGPHTFLVRAIGRGDAASDPAVWRWTVVRGTADSIGGRGNAAAGGESFSVRGRLAATLAPGLGGPLRLSVRNPHSYPIEVTSIVVSVGRGSTRRGCDGRTELAVRQSNVASGQAVLRVPPHTAVTLPTRRVSAPFVRMRNRPVNQDACKGARFTLRYSGVARRARGA
jgi:hypothetical protein